jgi:hypothetical protein
MSTPYKKHLIDAKVYLRPNGGWGAEALIYREHGSYGTEKVFAVPGTFGKKERAVDAAVILAKQKIDEGYDDSGGVEDTDPNP